MRALLLILTGILCLSQGMAQAPQAPTGARLHVIPTTPVNYTNPGLQFDPLSQLDSTDQVQLQVVCWLADTINLSEIQVNLGTTAQGTDVHTATFTYDAAPPTGHGYLRKQRFLCLDLGNHAFTRPLYAEIKVKNNQGQWSSAASWNAHQ